MFSAARWRLTLVFTGALVVVLVACGIVVYLTTRSVIYDRVDHDLEDRARTDLVLFQRGPHEEPDKGPPGPHSDFDPGGYFYAISNPDGQILSSSPYLDSQSLASTTTLGKVINKGDTFTDTKSSKGEPQRIYVFPVTVQGGGDALVQIGRSTEPEEAALSQLRIILLAVLAVSTVPAVAGGYMLSGRVLRPIKVAMDSQRTFIADASHELRTPVAVVRTNAELLKRHVSARTQATTTSGDQVALDDILSESDRLSRMVDQMLTLAEADAGQRIVITTKVSLNELVDELVRSMRSLAAAKQVLLETQMPEKVSVNGDPDRLRELISVLLDNAVKYSDASGRVEVSLAKEHRKGIITVSDSGAGIPAEALPHIFDRFYRVDKARSRESGGTGLGLAIARHIVDAHGGTINIESSEGVGTTVTVELPA